MPSLLDANATGREIEEAVLIIVDGKVLKHRYGRESGTTIVTFDGEVVYRPNKES